MIRSSSLRLLSWGLFGGAGIALATYYFVIFVSHGTFYGVGYLFPQEPRIQSLGTLSAAQPRLRLPDLLDERWEYVCFVPPYYPVEQDAKLAGANIPWVNDDGMYTVVLKRGADFGLHRIDRATLAHFWLVGLAEGEVCYADSDVVLEYVTGDGPVIVRVTPH